MTSMDQRNAACEELIKAVLDRGPRPDVHDKIMAKHRREWPTLWRAIDKIVSGGF